MTVVAFPCAGVRRSAGDCASCWVKRPLWTGVPCERGIQMEDAGTARLVEGVPFDVATRGVTATLRRSDIEEAARSADGPAELLLDVTRGEGADVQAHSLAIEWSRADLDQLLRDADTADDVTIAFDRDEMAAAIDAGADVEAHGLREKALVFTVVAVTAASTAGVAQARPTAGPTGDTASASAPAPVQAPATTVGGAGSGTITDPAASPATTIGGAGVEPAEQAGVVTAAPATVTGGASASDVTSPTGSPATTIGGAGAPVASPAGARGGSAVSDGGGVSSRMSARKRLCSGPLASRSQPLDSPPPASGAGRSSPRKRELGGA